MNFSGVPDNFLGRSLRIILKIIPPNAQVRILQGKLKGKKWIAGSSVNGCWLGSYEYEKQILFEQTIQRGKVVFDLGANVGFYTLLSSLLVGDAGKVIAFEPLPRNYKLLRKHLSINRINNVEVIEAAVSEKAGTICFDEGPHASMGKIADQGNLEVQIVGLDELFNEGKIPSPDYLKIDIEGAEFLALKGAKKLIAQKHPMIFLATHGKEVHHDCLKFMTENGYRLSSINKEKKLEETDEVLAVYN